MKKILLATLLLGFAVSVQAADVYVKEEEKLKVTSVVESTEVKTYSLADLYNMKANKAEAITRNLDSYTSRDTSLKSELAEVNVLIAKALELEIAN